jgi:uncharacterized glyoxalase superfamily protein PhnB
VNAFLVVEVADVGAHYAHAVAAGADIDREPADQEYGVRNYRAIDPEGFHWNFSQKIREVTPAEWGATAAG